AARGVARGDAEEPDLGGVADVLARDRRPAERAGGDRAVVVGDPGLDRDAGRRHEQRIERQVDAAVDAVGELDALVLGREREGEGGGERDSGGAHGELRTGQRSRRRAGGKGARTRSGIVARVMPRAHDWLERPVVLAFATLGCAGTTATAGMFGFELAQGPVL